MLNVEFGITLNKIRKEKNFTISTLVDGVIANSTFTRFVQGKTTLAIDSFLLLLEKLNVTFEEFLLVNNAYELPPYQELTLTLEDAIARQNINKLGEIISQVKLELQQHPELMSFYDVVVLIKNKLENSPFNVTSLNRIKTYLFNAESWYHHELALFNNVIFIFSNEELLTFLTKATFNLDRYQSINNYGNEKLRLLLNVIRTVLLRGDLLTTLNLVKRLERANITSDLLYERTMQNFYVALVQFAAHNNHALPRLKKILSGLSLLDENNLHSSLVTLILATAQTYDIDKPDF